MSSQHVVFTINSYTPETEELIKIYFNDSNNKCTYIVYGREIGESGNAHLQGYLQWSEPKKFAPLAKRWKGHFEAAKGTAEQAATYCKKTGEFVEYGVCRLIDRKAAQKNNAKKGGEVRGEQLSRIWDEARLAAIEGRFNDIPSELYIKYEGNFRRIHQENQPKPQDLDGDLKNLWFHGEPGVGKSKAARLIATSNDFYYTKARNKWWDNYNGESIIILDEVSPRDAEWIGEFLKIWCDRYCFQAEIKGSSRIIRPKHMIITSNYSIDNVFEKLNDDMLVKAIKRRMHSVHMTSAYQPENLANFAKFWREWLGFDAEKEKPREAPFKIPVEAPLMDLDN